VEVENHQLFLLSKLFVGLYTFVKLIMSGVDPEIGKGGAQGIPML